MYIKYDEFHSYSCLDSIWLLEKIDSSAISLTLFKALAPVVCATTPAVFVNLPRMLDGRRSIELQKGF